MSFFFGWGGDPKLMQIFGEFEGLPMDLRLVLREP